MLSLSLSLSSHIFRSSPRHHLHAKVLCWPRHECQGNACSLVSLEDRHYRDNLEVKQTLETNKAEIWVWDWGIIWWGHVHMYMCIWCVTAACVRVCVYLHTYVCVCFQAISCRHAYIIYNFVHWHYIYRSIYISSSWRSKFDISLWGTLPDRRKPLSSSERLGRCRIQAADLEPAPQPGSLPTTAGSWMNHLKKGLGELNLIKKLTIVC